VLVWFVALAGLGLPAFAQVNTGNVYGNVTDEQGMAVPGGTATLTGPAAPMTTSVEANGLFRFLKVPPGKYTVTIVMPGFTTVTRENVQVSVGKNTPVDVQLKLSSIQATVTVTSETPLLDPRRVETGQNFSHDELAEIPTSRDVWSLIQQVPGVQVDTVNVAGAQSGIAGGPDMVTKGSGNVVYQIDGATTTDNTYGNPFQRQNGGTNTFFDFSTFQDVEVATGGSVVEQQTSGVTINVVTKRGTNELHGTARFNYAAANWQSTNTPQEAIDQDIQTDRTKMLRDYGADVGGPIIRDKLWLWFAGGYQTISTITTGDPGQDVPPSKVNLEPWSAKLNWQVASSNSAQLYYQRSFRDQFNNRLGTTRDVLAATQLTIPPTSTRSRTRTSSGRTSSLRSSRPTSAPTTRISPTARRAATAPRSRSCAPGTRRGTRIGSTPSIATTTRTTGPRTRRSRPTSRPRSFSIPARPTTS